MKLKTLSTNLSLSVFGIRVDSRETIKRPFDPLLPQGTAYRILRPAHRWPPLDGEFVTIQLDNGDTYNVDRRYLPNELRPGV